MYQLLKRIAQIPGIKSIQNQGDLTWEHQKREALGLVIFYVDESYFYIVEEWKAVAKKNNNSP